MDALPGTPQIQNIIPTTFFKTNTWAAPWLGVIGALFILVTGLAYLEWRRRRAAAAGEGYGTKLVNEPEAFADEKLPNPWLAIAAAFHRRRDEQGVHAADPPFLWRPLIRPTLPGLAKPVITQVSSVAAIWAVEGALLARHPHRASCSPSGRCTERFAEGSKAAIGGALLAVMNTASEYGFGAVIAALPGFLVVADALKAIPGSAGQRSDHRDRAGGHHRLGLGRHEHRAGGDGRHLHRRRERRRHPARGAAPRRLHGERRHGHPAAQRRGHHAARRHRAHAQAVLRDIFAITLIKTAAVVVVIGVFYLTGIY